MVSRLWVTSLLLGTLVQLPGPDELGLPNRETSLRFAVIGDAGTGGRRQQEVADRMLSFHAQFPIDLTLMLGDNLYGSEKPGDYVRKFERPYAELLARDVTFRAVLGNHDEPSQRLYDGFNMGGQRYYSFAPKAHDVRFFAVDSTQLDQPQVDWLTEALSRSTERWKICFFHHPIYSSGERHGSDLGLRAILEPLFVEHGVNVVFAGHEHFYERVVPQQGVHHFVSGAAGKLRRGNVRRDSELTAQRFDGDYSFMLLELDEWELHYQVIARSGRTVDLGTIEHPGRQTAAVRKLGPGPAMPTISENRETRRPVWHRAALRSARP